MHTHLYTGLSAHTPREDVGGMKPCGSRAGEEGEPGYANLQSPSSKSLKPGCNAEDEPMLRREAEFSSAAIALLFKNFITIFLPLAFLAETTSEEAGCEAVRRTHAHPPGWKGADELLLLGKLSLMGAGDAITKQESRGFLLHWTCPSRCAEMCWMCPSVHSSTSDPRHPDKERSPARM